MVIVVVKFGVRKSRFGSRPVLTAWQRIVYVLIVLSSKFPHLSNITTIHFISHGAFFLSYTMASASLEDRFEQITIHDDNDNGAPSYHKSKVSA